MRGEVTTAFRRNRIGYASFWALDPETQTLRFQQESGAVSEAFRKVTTEAQFARGVGLIGRAWAERDLVFAPELAEMRACVRAPAALESGVRSGLCFPVESEGQLIGTMDFFSLSRLHFSEAQLEFWRTIGRFVSAAVERLTGFQLERVEAERQQLGEPDRRAVVVGADLVVVDRQSDVVAFHASGPVHRRALPRRINC